MDSVRTTSEADPALSSFHLGPQPFATPCPWTLDLDPSQPLALHVHEPRSIVHADGVVPDAT